MESITNATLRKWKYLKKYLHAYTTIVSCYFPRFIYIDALAGEGKYLGYHGSPLIALNLEFPFTDYIFIEKDKNRLNKLKKHVKEFSNRKAITFRKKGKATEKKINISFKNMEAKYFINNNLKEVPDYPCFIFLDPYGVEELDMDAVEECSKKKRAELLINFSAMGILRNVGNERCHDLITKYYGSEKWKDIPNKAINRGKMYAELYIKSLKQYFEFIIDNPIKTDNKAPLYHLIFTTNNESGYKIMKDVMKIKDEQIGLRKFFSRG